MTRQRLMLMALPAALVLLLSGWVAVEISRVSRAERDRAVGLAVNEVLKAEIARQHASWVEARRRWQQAEDDLDSALAHTVIRIVPEPETPAHDPLPEPGATVWSSGDEGARWFGVGDSGRRDTVREPHWLRVDTIPMTPKAKRLFDQCMAAKDACVERAERAEEERDSERARADSNAAALKRLRVGEWKLLGIFRRPTCGPGGGLMVTPGEPVQGGLVAACILPMF